MPADENFTLPHSCFCFQVWECLCTVDSQVFISGFVKLLTGFTNLCDPISHLVKICC